MQIKDNQWLSVDQAAKLLGWMPQRLQYHIKSGKEKPPYTIQGNHKLFDPASLLNWKAALLDARKVPKRNKNEA